MGSLLSVQLIRGQWKQGQEGRAHGRGVPWEGCACRRGVLAAAALAVLIFEGAAMWALGNWCSYLCLSLELALCGRGWSGASFRRDGF